MSNQPSHPQDLAPPVAEEAPDPAILRAERRLRLLEELSEIGMELARTLRPAAVTGDTAWAAPAQAQAKGQGAPRDPTEAFGPLSRAIRLTLALEARTDQDLRDLKAGIVRTREAERTRAAERRQRAAANESETRKSQIRWLIAEAAEAEIGEAEAFEDLMAALDERLDHDGAYWDCAERPLRETVERLCADLTLKPDWSRWTGEGWICEGPPTRSRFSPFHTQSARPLLEEPQTGPEPQNAALGGGQGRRHDLQ